MYDVGVMLSYERGVVQLHLHSTCVPRNYRYEQDFFSYVCNGKKIKELFASTLGRIPSNVRCVSSMMVVLNAKFVLLLAAHANKKLR